MIKVLYVVEPMLGIGPNIDANLIAKKAARKFAEKVDIRIVLERDAFQREQSPNVSWEYLTPWRLDFINDKLIDLSGNELSQEEKDKRASLLIDICNSYKPDVLLLHNYMSGSKWDAIIDFEMLPLIGFAKKQNSHIKIVSYMIGMLDGFENVTKEEEDFFLVSVQKNMDKVFLRSDSLDLFIQTCPPAACRPDLFVPVGYSADDDTPIKLLNTDDKYIIVSAGGGDIAINLFKKSIETCALLKDTVLGKYTWKVFLGPMQEKNANELRNYSQSFGCADKVELIIKADEKVFLSYLMYNCLISISQCGQRTFTNLEVTGARSILIPRESDGKEFEQLNRAQYVDNIGRAKLIREKDMTPKILADCVIQTYQNTPTRLGLQMNGPENLLKSIVGICGE